MERSRWAGLKIKTQLICVAGRSSGSKAASIGLDRVQKERWAPVVSSSSFLERIGQMIENEAPWDVER